LKARRDHSAWQPQSKVSIDRLILSSMVRLLIRFERPWCYAGLYMPNRLTLFLALPGLRMNPWLAACLAPVASSTCFWLLSRLDSAGLLGWIVAIAGPLLLPRGWRPAWPLRENP
jgi:hypothetical protein